MSGAKISFEDFLFMSGADVQTKHKQEPADSSFVFSLSVIVTKHGVLIKACHTVLPAYPWLNHSACCCVPEGHC